jgi:predicted Abi (CAAX) family protease
VSGRVLVVALHLVSGLLAYALLRTARRPLQTAFGLSSAEAQIGVIMTGVMLLMGVGTFVLARVLDGLGPRETLRLTGATRLDGVGVVLAVVIWLAVLAVGAIVSYEDDLRTLVERVDWLALPDWHFQRSDGFQDLAPALGAFALAANLVCEELWFRGYLEDKLAFLGRLGWVVAGLLFTLYHVFEAPTVYPRFLGGLALAGLWALRRNLWPCILLHTLFTAAG